MRLFFFEIIAVIAFSSCSDNSTNQVKTDTKITGELENYKGGFVVFERLETQQVVLEDTLEVDEDGNFSYYVDCNDKSDVLSTTFYGSEFCSGFSRKNIFGFQFHPEKSHKFGFRLMENFAQL